MEVAVVGKASIEVHENTDLTSCVGWLLVIILDADKTKIISLL